MKIYFFGALLQRLIRQLSLVLFFDFFSYAGLIPLIPLFVLPTQLSIVSQTYDLQARYIILGFLLATYPLAQMLAAPFLGYLADRFGKKKLLALSYLGNAVGYILTAVAILYGEIAFVFVGHFIAGITGCNQSIVQAIIGETGESRKQGLFSIQHIAIGSGFLLGPLLIGTLLDRFQWSHEGTYCFLFFCVAICLLNLFLLKKIFKNIPDHSETTRVANWVVSLKSILKLGSRVQFRLTSGMLFFLGWYGFIKLFQAYLISETEISITGIFSILSYFGFCSLSTQIFLYFFSRKRELSVKAILLFYVCLGIGIAFCLANRETLSIYCGATLFSAAHAILTTTLISRVSVSAGNVPQGTVMGLYQAGQSFAKVVAPILSSFLMAISASSSVLWSMGLLAVSALVFYYCEMKKEKPVLDL